MDQPDLNQEVLDVRKVIEKSTSKVSLRDLEKKGFRQVKVLRAGDINQLIFKAVQNVLAKQPRGVMSDEERKRIVKEAKSELDKQMAEKRQIAADKQQIEEAKKRLEETVAQLNKQILAEKRTFQEEKKDFERQKQALYEKGLESQEAVSQRYEGRVGELQSRLAKAEAKLESAEEQLSNAVSVDDYEQLRQRCIKSEDELSQAISAEEHQRLRDRTQRQIEELEDAERRAVRRANQLNDEVERLQEEVNKLRAEGASSGMGSVDAQELQRMRFEMEQRDSRMKTMIAGLAESLGKAGGGGGGDMSKQFKQLQLSMTDQIRKAVGGLKGGGDWDLGDLSPEAAAALFSNALDDVQMETNATNVEIQSTKAGSVKDKLARLRNMKKG